jgi:hypothetical protein
VAGYTPGRHRKPDPLNTGGIFTAPIAVADPEVDAAGTMGAEPWLAGPPDSDRATYPEANAFGPGADQQWPPEFGSGPWPQWDSPPPEMHPDHPSAPVPRIPSGQAPGPARPGGAGDGGPQRPAAAMGSPSRLPKRQPGAGPNPGNGAPSARAQARPNPSVRGNSPGEGYHPWRDPRAQGYRAGQGFTTGRYPSARDHPPMRANPSGGREPTSGYEPGPGHDPSQGYPRRQAYSPGRGYPPAPGYPPARGYQTGPGNHPPEPNARPRYGPPQQGAGPYDGPLQRDNPGPGYPQARGYNPGPGYPAAQTATITDEAWDQAAAIRRAAVQDAATIRQQATDQAAAIRRAAEREVAELSGLLLAMSGELGRVSAYLSENSGPPDGLATRPAPALPPVIAPPRPRTRPDGPATRPATRPATKPAARPGKKPHGRQRKAAVIAKAGIASMVTLALTAGITEVAVHGPAFFVFRNGGTGATPDSGQDDQQFLAQQRAAAQAAHKAPVGHHAPKGTSGQ